MFNDPASVDPLPKVWDENTRIGDMLKGRRGLVVGVANGDSIAFGCAAKLRAFGAEIALTYLNDKARPYVEPLAAQLDASLLLPLDVTRPGQMAVVFEQIRSTWGSLDFVIHSIAFAPRDDLHGRIVDCSQGGFLQAMQVSCHSFIEMAHHAEPWSRACAIWPKSWVRRTSGCLRCRRVRCAPARPRASGTSTS